MVSDPSDRQLELAAEILKALAEPHRLKILLRLARGEMSVGQLADADEENITTVSARLKVLLTAGLVKRRRKGQTIFYAVADAHVLNLVDNAIEHACEEPRALFEKEGKEPIVPQVHANHPHKHGPGCGHVAIRHGDHVDYLHDGHLHHQNGSVVEEHKIEVSAANPDKCTPAFGHTGHSADHVHGPTCGHPAIPHGEHVDYLVDGRLHHPHGDHCDDHGPVTVM
jgi:DNA-binding transcriptional ArsR family regulator